MYRYAASLKLELRLSEFELHETKTLEYLWLGAAGVGVICIVLALTLQQSLVPYSGFAFALLSVWFPLLRARRKWRDPQ
jgi:hypothetical protein